VDKLYYSYSDYQGSLVALTNEDGTVAERYAYDPWGVRANPDRWEERDTRTSWIVNRGYTGHEHLDAFGVIDMNGRVYDPFTALFMSPDPYVQSPSDWLNYNRYSYCLNNPFKYTDPSGEIAFLLIPAVALLIKMATAAAVGAAIAGAFSVATTIVNGSSWDANSFWKSVGNGAISGAITFGIGSAFGATGGAAASFANVNKGFLGISNAFLNEAGRAGAHALAQGAMTAADGGNFWAGAASGAFGSISGHTLDALKVDFVVNNAFGVIAFSALNGGMGSVFAGGDFWEGAKSGAIVGALNAEGDVIVPAILKGTVQVAHKVKHQVKKAIRTVQKFSNDLDNDLGGQRIFGHSANEAQPLCKQEILDAASTLGTIGGAAATLTGAGATVTVAMGVMSSSSEISTVVDNIKGHKMTVRSGFVSGAKIGYNFIPFKPKYIPAVTALGIWNVPSNIIDGVNKIIPKH
jgi:RHS repeat-associated protein